MPGANFDNRSSGPKRHFQLGTELPWASGEVGARFEKVTIDEEIGPEIVLFIIDPTPFAQQLKRDLLDLRLKAGVVETGQGPVLCLLWWMPPVTNGKPFGLYEHLLNPSHPGVLELLKEIECQTCIHVVLIGPENQVLDVYELGNSFGFEKLIPTSEQACNSGTKVDFSAATEEFSQTYDLIELFNSSGLIAEAQTGDEEDYQEESAAECDDEFVMTRPSRILVEGAIWLAGRLLTHPASSVDEHATLAKALLGLSRLPRPTRGLIVDFGFSVRRRADIDLLYWSVHLDETEVQWTAGGHLNGPCGADSFTSFQLSLYRGAEDVPLGDVDTWLGCRNYANNDIDISTSDGSDAELWDRHAPCKDP